MRSADLSISIGFTSPQLTINGNTAGSSVVLGSGSSSSNLLKPDGISLEGIQPAPLVTVNEQEQLESPFVTITQQAAELSQQTVSQPDPVSPTSDLVDPDKITSDSSATINQALQGLNQQSSQVRERRSELESQATEINNEIRELRQKEQEINRKKFQLQNASIGNRINLQA